MKKNILIISESLTSGGAEKVAANLATDLLEENNVWLLLIRNNVHTYNTKANIIELNVENPKNIMEKIFWWFRVLKKVKFYKKKLKITHTISFLSRPDTLNVFTNKNNKTIISIRNKRSSLNKNFLTKTKDRIVFKRANKIIALSYGVKNDLINFYKIEPNKIDVIYNACDITNINEKIRDIKNNGKNEFKVITAGRLTYQKGQWHLIRAFKKVVKEIPKAKLFILGQGEEEKYLNELINQLNLQDNVKLLGYHKNPYKYMAECDLFVFSSIYEGFGNILLEAMACGLPIISTDCFYGPRELLDGMDNYEESIGMNSKKAKYGILVPNCDNKKYEAFDNLTNEEEIMAKTIIDILSNDEELKKYAEMSNERIKEFNPKVITKKWNEMINKV